MGSNQKIFRRGILMLAAGVLSFTFAMQAGAQDTGLTSVAGFRLGAKPEDPEAREKFPRFTGTLATENLKPDFDLSANFPKPHNKGQGDQGSCTAWAVAFGVKTYHERKDQKWDQNVPEHQFSPAFIYNQLNGGFDQGVRISTALDLVTRGGAATFATSPYNDKDYTTLPTLAARVEAERYKMESWQEIPISDATQLKAFLASGTPIIFSILVDNSFGVLKPNEVWNGPTGQTGLHAMVVVGYDDKKANPGQPKGAFKILNSWGDDWATGGYGWISYEAFKKANIAFVTKDVKTNSP